MFSQEIQEKTVPGDETSTVLEGLTPETLYQVSVVAAYPHKESEPLTGSEITDGKTFNRLFSLSSLAVRENACMHKRMNAEKIKKFIYNQ